MRGDVSVARTEQQTLQLIAQVSPKSAITEMYRGLRTNLDFASVDAKVKRILVTSSLPGEGKTTTACNLAVVEAQAGRRTLLLDADLRKPMVHRNFSASNAKGLTSVLIRQCSVEDAIQKTAVENLEILCSGPIPPNPLEMLGSQAMRSLLDQFAATYDVLIVDSPPVLSVADAKVLASELDGVLYVVGSGIVSRSALRKAKESLAVSGVRVLGAVFNNKRMTKAERQYYYYQYE